MEMEMNPKKRPLSPSSPPPPRLVTAPLTQLEILGKEARRVGARCDESLHIDLQAPMFALVSKGMVTDALMLRSEKSVKESWETDLMPPINYSTLLSVEYNDRRQRRNVKAYLKSAAEDYFEASPDRPDGITEGFHRLYPEDQDTIFQSHPNIKKFADLVPELGVVAVVTHNFITGSNLRFSKVEKANLFFSLHRHYYFITLEAEDDESGETITCRSRVCCSVQNYEWLSRKFNAKDVVIHSTRAESFELVKCST